MQPLETTSEPAHSRSHRLHEALHHVAHLLPAQGPIGVFVHHNTLHAFEDQPFEQAVAEAARMFGAEPYMSEAAYCAAAASSNAISKRLPPKSPIRTCSRSSASRGARSSAPY
jgi:uncharacterized protein